MWLFLFNTHSYKNNLKGYFMKHIKIFVCILIAFALLLPTLVACSGGSTEAIVTTKKPSKTQAPKKTTARPNTTPIADSVAEYLYKYADMAFENMVKNYWTGNNPNEGYFLNSESHIFWRFTMVMLSFDTYYKVTGNENVRNYIKSQYKYWLDTFDEEWITTAGGHNNPAADDAAWTSMAMILCYEITGDERALDLCYKTIRNAYDFWADNEGISHGLYYRTNTHSVNANDKVTKTLYAVGLMHSALKCYEISDYSAKYLSIYEDTLELYKWTEEHLLRDGSKEYEGVRIANDYIYYNDFTDDPVNGIFRPAGLYSPDSYGCSSLFGNMGMACVHKKLYDITKEDKYLDRAVRTANAIADYYDYSGTLINDRDAWTDGAFIGYFTDEVMELNGVDARLGRTFMKTVYSIMNNCYFKGGYYGGHWNNARDWYDSLEYGNPMTIMTSATTTHVIYAAALAQKKELIASTEDDLKLFQRNYKEEELDDYMKEAGEEWINKKEGEK